MPQYTTNVRDGSKARITAPQHCCPLPLNQQTSQRHTLPDLRWFWSITVYVHPKLGIITSGRAASLDEAKAQFLSNWQRCRADSTPSGQRST